MNWFGRKAAAADAARPALARVLGTASVSGAWPRAYEAQLREAYLGNAVAQRSVKLIAESVGGAPLSGSDPALLALVTARSAGQALMETIAAQLLLHGNAFIQILPDSAGAPGELFALRPERVSILPDAQGWPAAYGYRVGERSARFAAEQIVHVKAFHPADDHYGLGCLGAAAGAVAIHNAATRWNKALLDNAARPSGALVFDAGDGAADAGA